MRRWTLGLVVISALLSACHRHKPANAVTPEPESTENTDDIVGWSITSDDPPTLLAAFDIQAQKHNCATTPKSESVVASCSEGVMVMLAEGSKVTIACKGITIDQCRMLFGRIADEGSSTAAAAPPPPDPDALVIVYRQPLTAENADSAIPKFLKASKKAGCVVMDSNETTAVVQCDEGRAGANITDTTLILGCFGMTEDDCMALHTRILKTL